MRNKTLVFITIILLLSGIHQTNAQLTITSFSDLNDVYSLKYHNDTMWIGTSGGIVYRVLSDFTVAYTLTQQTDGLGSNFITAIEIDNNGNKFFGSFDNGVTVYNAGSSTIYNSGNAPIDDRIICLAKDNNGHIWAGTPSGAYRFNGTDWDSFNTALEVEDEVNAIATDGNFVWFGTTNDGLFKYDIVNITWRTETVSDGNIASDHVTALAARNDSLLVGTSSGISFFNPDAGGSWMTETVGANEDIFDLLYNNFGTFYASTSDGLYSSGGSIWNKESMLPNSPTGVIELRDFEIWVGFNEYGGGVQPFDFSTPPPPHMVTGNQYPGKNEITDIVSGNNLMYFSTPGNGLTIYDGINWSVINTDMPSLNFNAMVMQADTLWLASDDNGIVRFFEGIWDNYSPIDPKVNDIAVDRSDPNLIWCGTATGGAYSFKNFAPDDIFTDANGMLSNEVIAITVDTNNEVWFLHKTGATIYNGSALRTVTLADLGVNTAQLFDIDADSNGGVWIANTEGVIEYNAGTVTNYTMADGLTDDFVISVHVDQRNYKFFGTNNHGISILSDHGWQKIGKINGILTDKITAIYYEDGRNLIWSAGKWGGISNTFVEPISVSIASFMSTICYGNTINLAAIVTGGFGPGSYNYSWTSSDAAFTSTNQSETVQPERSTTYTLEANDGYNNGNINASVTVNLTDTSDIAGHDTICPNGKVVHYSASNSTGTVKNYSWSINGGNIVSDNTQSTIDVTWFTDIANGSLYLTETDINDCSVTQQFDVEVITDFKPEIILKNGGRILICRNPGLSYQWYRNEVPIPGADRQFYYLGDQTDLIDGVYYVEIDTLNNCKLASNYIDVYSTGVKAYPVPTKNTLNIDFSTEINETGKTVIRSIGGTIIEQIPFAKESRFKHIQVDVSNYKPGTYFYTIYLGSEQIKIGKFIIN